jgi:hypothetical protein
MTRLVTIATFDNVLDAGYWRALLESQGIPVAAIDQEIVAVEWQIARAVGNIKLQVPESEATRAVGILRELRGREPPKEPGAPEDPLARRALRAAFLGLLLPPLQLYSLLLVARLLPRWRELPKRDRRQAMVAVFVDLWFPVAACAYVYVVVG